MQALPTQGSSLEEPILKVEGLSVIRSGKLIIEDIDLTVRKGEFVGIVGPNGSGKTTLLLTILGILKANSGKIRIYGSKPMSKELDGKISWVSQAASNLPSDLRVTVRELVELGALNRGNMFSRWRDKEKVNQAIEMVGLQDVENTDVGRLSGGQRQRVAVGRALVNKPSIILADEPTGNLDSKTSAEIMNLFNQIHESGNTVIMVTHEEDIAAHAQRVIRLKDGMISSDTYQEKMTTV